MLWIIVIGLGVVGFGISGEDARGLREFVGTVDRFKSNPEFRAVGAEYVAAGSKALQGRFWGGPMGRVLYNLRRMPGLPTRLAANDHLALHYQHFSEGVLSAYLHLTERQGVTDAIGMLEALGRKETVGDEDARAFLRSFDVWPAVVTDEGAVASVRKLVGDVEPGRGFVHRGAVDGGVMPSIQRIARRKGYPVEAGRMSPEQQAAVLGELDGEVMAGEPEVWRTKQVNDFLNGVWGQTFGRSYGEFTRCVLWARWIGRVVVVMGVAGVLIRVWRRRRGGRFGSARLRNGS